MNGVMADGDWKGGDMTVAVALWAVHDPDGVRTMPLEPTHPEAPARADWVQICAP